MQSKDCVITSQYIKTPGIVLEFGVQIPTIKGQEKLVFHAYSDNQEPFGLLTMKSNIMCAEEELSTLEVNVTILEHLLGFENSGDQFLCDHRLLEVLKTLNCFIDNVSIKINEDGWFDYDESYDRIYSTCQLNYCALKESDVMGSHLHVQCDNNHGGILCRSCISSYCLVLGILEM